MNEWDDLENCTYETQFVLSDWMGDGWEVRKGNRKFFGQIFSFFIENSNYRADFDYFEPKNPWDIRIASF